MYFKNPKVIVASIIAVAVIAVVFFFLGYNARNIAMVNEVHISDETEVYIPTGPYLAVVLDDCGYSKRNLNDINRLGVPVTLAVLPGTPYAEYVSEFANENGIETIVHMPMEPMRKDVALEKETIMVGMSPEEVETAIDDALEKVPYAKGINNHMGSKFTCDKDGVNSIMTVLEERGLYFLDSLTTGRSVCAQSAEEHGVDFMVRDVFLDNSSDKKEIASTMDKVGKILESGKNAIAIGHDRPNTVAVLKDYVAEFEEKGYKFVSLSELIELEKR